MVSQWWRLEAYDYPLPRDLIAQEPVEPRDEARLLVLYPRTRSWVHTRFHRLAEFLQPGDLIVANNSRVLPARLRVRLIESPSRTGEILFLRLLSPSGHWRVLAKPARRFRPGSRIVLPGEYPAEVVEAQPGGVRILSVPPDLQVLDYLESFGTMPIPPYIRKGRANARDRQWYQTVYARNPGSVAAPTAGLHVTPRVRTELEHRGVHWEEITLHVGPGTFRPVRTRDIRHHRLDAEYYEIPGRVWETLERIRKNGGRIVALGTTTVRALESAAAGDPPRLHGWTSLFIHPGYRFRRVNGLVTNFHLPKSSLLMLCCAFAEPAFLMASYREAIRARYRFYSYGDAMLILP